MPFDVWLERYRPRILSDIYGQDDIVKRLKAYVESRNFPNLMFSGPPGTGKTTAALCMARELFGIDWKGNFKELNSSDDRGIDTVRNEIKNYANTKPYGQYDFKVLLLDECDSLTSDAQSALRRTMEKFSSSCKFILSCNYSNKIIEPIQSRCTLYRFRGIHPDDMKTRLIHISKTEGLSIDNSGLDAIIYVAEFDMRKAINALQTASMMNRSITVENIYKSSGITHPEHIRSFIETSLEGDFISSLEKLDIMMILEGLDALDILNQMMKEVMIINVPDKNKLDIIDSIGECDFRISDGANPRIQMKSLIAKLVNIGKR